MKKILIATEKPFAPAAVEGIRKIVEDAGQKFELLEKYTDKAELLESVKDANAIIIRSDKITREVIEAAPALEIVVRAGAGYDNVDLEAATENNVVVMNTPGQNSNAVAELVMGMMVYGARNQFNGKPGGELKDKTLGIHAYGYVGRRVAQIAKGFGMEVYAFDPFIPSQKMKDDGVHPVDSAADLYKNCQYVSLHIPATEKTRESINLELLQSMPAGATLVNSARKEVISEESLVKIFGIRDDFYYISDIEPGVADEIKEKFDGRYYFTPKKMGAQTAEANINAGLAAANQIIGFFKNGDTTYKVNQ